MAKEKGLDAKALFLNQLKLYVTAKLSEWSQGRITTIYQQLINKGDMKINGLDLINFSAVSEVLTGDKTKIRKQFIPKEYKQFMSELAEILEQKVITKC